MEIMETSPPSNETTGLMEEERHITVEQADIITLLYMSKLNDSLNVCLFKCMFDIHK